MKYIVVIHSNAATGELFASMSDEQRQRAFQSYFDIQSDLEQSGELIDSKALAEREQHIVTRGANGPVITDAPLPELTEVISGYYLVEVAGLDRAAEIAARFPEAEVEGGIRVVRTLTAEDFAAMGF